MANGKTMQAVVNLAGSIDPSLGKAIEQAQKKISGLNVKALAVGAAVGGIAVATGKAVVEAGKYMKDLGASFDDAADAIRIGTGATGDALDGLLDDFDAVYKSVPTTMEDASKAIADYNTRLGLTGPQLQEMGYSFETASALMGQLDKAGVNTDEVLGAMKKSVATLAKEGISASDGLAMYYEKIKNAGTAAEAASIASEIFGTRAGSTMAAAIRDGSLAVADLTAELQENGETIAGAADDTYDFAERLQVMKQGLEVALKPMANTVFDGLNKFMPTLQKLMEQITPAISKAVEAAAPFVDEFLTGAADALEDVLPLISQLAADLLPVLTQLMSTLLPPLLSLVQTLLPPLMQIVSAILPPIASLLATVLPIITQIVSAVLPVLVSIISSLLPVITPLLEVALQIVNSVIMPLLDPLMQLVQALLPPILSLIGAITPLLTPLLSILEPIASVLGTIVGWVSKIVSFGSGVISKIAGLFGGGGGGSTGVSGYATGGFTRGPSIAGEDPRYPTEAVISFNPAYRSQNLSYWAEAGRMLGASSEADYEPISSGSGTAVVYDLSGLSFSPQIKVEGDTDEDALIRKLRDLEPEFIDFILEALSRREGGAYVTADSRLY